MYPILGKNTIKKTAAQLAASAHSSLTPTAVLTCVQTHIEMLKEMEKWENNKEKVMVNLITAKKESSNVNKKEQDIDTENKVTNQVVTASASAPTPTTVVTNPVAVPSVSTDTIVEGTEPATRADPSESAPATSATPDVPATSGPNASNISATPTGPIVSATSSGPNALAACPSLLMAPSPTAVPSFASVGGSGSGSVW